MSRSSRFLVRVLAAMCAVSCSSVVRADIWLSCWPNTEPDCHPYVAVAFVNYYDGPFVPVTEWSDLMQRWNGYNFDFVDRDDPPADVDPLGNVNIAWTALLPGLASWIGGQTEIGGSMGGVPPR